MYHCLRGKLVVMASQLRCTCTKPGQYGAILGPTVQRQQSCPQSCTSKSVER